MGCDIHDFIEVRPKGGCDRWNTVADHVIGRCYATFAILGNVRNEWGLESTSSDRGFPDDAGDPVCAEAWRYGQDGHSHSWVSLKELIELDPGQTVTCRGFVDRKQFNEFKRLGRPMYWCNGIYTDLVKIVSNAEMGDLPPDAKDVFTMVEWKMKYSEFAPVIWGTLIPLMRKHLDDGTTPDDVRLVFFFDN